jgi:Legionella pneumophila major outer membrane protein precursor
MKKLLLVLLGLSLTGALQAQWCYSVGADALYWRPCTPVFRYAVRETNANGNNPRSRIRAIGGDYDWGFRLRAAYRPDACTALEVDYYYFQPTYSGSTNASGETLRGPLFNTTYTRVDAHERTTFQEANLRAIRSVWEGRCATLYGALGIRWLDVKDRRKAVGFAPLGTGLGRVDSDMWGVGAVVQAGLSYRIFSCLKLVGELGLSGLAGKRELKTFASSPAGAQISDLEYGSDTACFPGLENRLLLKYHRQCGCFSLSGHIGWDQKFYIDAMRFGSIFDQQPDTAIETIGVTGLVLGVSAGY